jgi:lipopolysaccharide export system protein LptA
MNHSVRIKIFSLFRIWLLFLLVLPYGLMAQTKKRVDIEQADALLHNESIIANAQRLIGNVRIRHNNIVMWCDSAYSYTNVNMVDGFGHVHILKDDTLHLYADFVNYNGDTKWAKAKDHVKLVNKSTTLTTDSLNYDMNRGIGYYDNYGTIVDSTSTLTSKIGEYYVSEDKAYFKTEVKTVTDDYTLESDTLIYELKTGTASIVGPTNIYNEKNNLYAIDGFYNTRTGKADLYKRPVITSVEQKITADSIFYDKVSGDGIARGDADIHDLKNRMIVKGNKAIYNDIQKTSQVTDSAQFWYYSEQDTLFLHADTLRTIPDTIPDQKIVKAYFHVRFYRADMQGKCDSLVYWSKDSTLQMFREPVVWSGTNQMTSDYIEMITEDKENQTVEMKENAFIIAQEDSAKFNQIKGRDMTGYIRRKDLYKIDVDGNGESIYYARDDNGIIGLNRAQGSNILIFLKERKVYRIVFVTSPEGRLSPVADAMDEERTLPGFNWLDTLRPKTYQDIFLKENEPVEEQK